MQILQAFNNFKITDSNNYAKEYACDIANTNYFGYL